MEWEHELITATMTNDVEGLDLLICLPAGEVFNIHTNRMIEGINPTRLG